MPFFVQFENQWLDAYGQQVLSEESYSPPLRNNQLRDSDGTQEYHILLAEVFALNF